MAVAIKVLEVGAHTCNDPAYNLSVTAADEPYGWM